MDRRTVRELAKAARDYAQSAYAGFTRSLQNEWIFLQRALPAIEPLFESLEEVIADEFLPALFGVPEIDDALRALSALPVKVSGIGVC